jgi:hypothetical protein
VFPLKVELGDDSCDDDHSLKVQTAFTPNEVPKKQPPYLARLIWLA